MKKHIIEQDVEKLVIVADEIIKNTIKQINYEIILMYWKLGKIVFDYKKEHNSKHGDSVVEKLSRELSLKYGSGFGLTNIWYSKKFYENFKKLPTSEVFENVTWSHCREIINENKIILLKTEQLEI